MSFAVLNYDKISEDKLEVYVVNTADPDEIITLFLSEFKKDNTIRDCEQIRNKIITDSSGFTPPWWYIVAKNMLTRIYRSENKMSEARLVIKRILSYRAICENDSYECDITDYDKLKIADAMIWIHQNENLPDRSTGAKMTQCLSFIRHQVCLSLDFH